MSWGRAEPVVAINIGIRSAATCDNDIQHSADSGLDNCYWDTPSKTRKSLRSFCAGRLSFDYPVAAYERPRPR